MKRWAICRMVTTEDGSTEPALAAHTANLRVIHSGARSWVLCQFSAVDLTAITADGDIRVLPDATLDQLWSSLNAITRSAIVAALQAAGFSTTAIKSSWTIRQILNHLGGQIQPGFSCEAGDVKDLP